MTEIKTNKLTKETGKENREGKMKEDVQMTDAENKTGAEAGTQPKKKNISAVFRPQNSKTGMVKPGSRPKPARQNANKSQDAAKVPAKAADAQEKNTSNLFRPICLRLRSRRGGDPHWKNEAAPRSSPPM